MSACMLELGVARVLSGERAPQVARELHVSLRSLRARLRVVSARLGAALGPQSGNFQLNAGSDGAAGDGGRRGEDEEEEFEGPLNEDSYIYEVHRSDVVMDRTAAVVKVSTDEDESSGSQDAKEAEWASCGSTYPSKRRRAM